MKSRMSNAFLKILDMQIHSCSVITIFAEQERYPLGTPGGLGGQFKPKSGIREETEKNGKNKDSIHADYQQLLDAISKVRMNDPRGEVFKTMLSEQIVAAIEKTSAKLLQDIDTVSSKSDLASQALKGTPASIRLSRIVENGKKLIGDIAVVASSTVLGVTERLVEMDIGKDIKDAKEIKQEFKKVAKSAISEEKEFLKRQIKGLRKIANKVSDRVADYFKKQRLEGEKRWKKAKQILDDAKPIQSADSMGEWQDGFEKSLVNLPNLDISELLNRLNSNNLDDLIDKILSTLLGSN